MKMISRFKQKYLEEKHRDGTEAAKAEQEGA